MTAPRFAFAKHTLARRAGVRPSTLNDDLRDGAPTPPKEKRHVAAWLRAYTAWREERAATRATPPPGGGDNRTPGEKTWSERGAQARALSTIFDLQVRQSKYVLREAVDDQRTRQVLAVTAALDSMARLAGSKFGAEVQAWMESEHRAICDRFADSGDDETDDVASSGAALAVDVVEHEDAGNTGNNEERNA